GEGERAKSHGVADELTGPGDPRRPAEGDRGVDQPTRAGEITIDQQAAGTQRRELDGPAFRVPHQMKGELGRRCAFRGAARLELDVSLDPLPAVASPRAGSPERVPSLPEDLDPVLDRLGEDGEDEQRDGGHGTPW